MGDLEVSGEKNNYLFNVEIRRSGKLLSISDLEMAYQIAKEQYGWLTLKTHDFLSSKKAKNILYDLLSSEKYIKYSRAEYLKDCQERGLLKILKSIGVWKTEGRGTSKKRWCIPKVWKFIYINLFNDYSQLNCPEWINDIDISIQKYSTKRNESQEKVFIDSLISKTALINSEIKRQFHIGKFRYDLKIVLLNIPFLIEYNEEQHSSQLETDLIKYNLAIENGFAYLAVPYNKEEEQFDYLNRILKESHSVEMINELEWFRFNSLIDEKYARLINERVFGQHISGMRNLASARELAKVSDIEKLVISTINLGFVKTEEDLINTIKKG